MARGGKRDGAGRKPGTPNKASIERQKKVAATGITPLDYMLKVMRDPKADAGRRDDMAKAAAPYVHPKLASMQHTGRGGGPIQTMDVTKLKGMTDQELELLERALVQIGIVDGDQGREGGEED
ncbi:hypothetical protein L598_000700000920 [Mesorhizobium sp. J18]|uniref:hypothetical protein n=1 Tax=Mesorhizobium sp. J18 TaxID=935263 RepID=UPI00119ABA59|nr:hypothetical protein [Mesorhizobium sp. J18]TWG90335.1 hypothetical protein L598_000700000920 [Mesorhizobium sp. J18]